jgi:hypothetical protein
MPATMFGIVPTGLPVITQPSSELSPTSLLYWLPSNKHFSHIVVFLLPGTVLPQDSAAAIYLATSSEVTIAANEGRSPSFKFLGGVGVGKESSIFQISAPTQAPTESSENGLVLGISIEPAESVSERIQSLANKNTTSQSATQPSTSHTVVLAQKIIKSAFNFLASFSGTVGPAQVEVVPLKAFEEWWRKFEARIRADPGFLEKQND